MAREFDLETSRGADPPLGARRPTQPTPEMTAEVLASGGMVGPEQMAAPLTPPSPTMRGSRWQGLSPGAIIGGLCLALAAVALAATFLVHGAGVGS